MTGHTICLVVDREASALSEASVARVLSLSGGEARWLARGEACDISCAALLPAAEVLRDAAGPAVDVLVLPTAGRRKRLLIADMDGTVVRGETLDALAECAGVGAEVAALTLNSIEGREDFASSLRSRVAMLAGARLDLFRAALVCTEPMRDAATLVATMRAHGAQTWIATGSDARFASSVASALGCAGYRANHFPDEAGALLGTVAAPVFDAAGKAAFLAERSASAGLGAEAVLAIGDGANDRMMLAAAGLGIAFRASAAAREAASFRLDHAGLRGVLFAQGYCEEEFVPVSLTRWG